MQKMSFTTRPSGRNKPSTDEKETKTESKPKPDQAKPDAEKAPE